MIIYKIPGKNRGPKGTTYDYRGVEEDAIIPKGWHKTLDAAVKASLPKKPKAKE